MASMTRLHRRSIPLIIIALLLFVSLRRNLSRDTQDTKPIPAKLPEEPPLTLQSHGRFWSAFHDFLTTSDPRCNSPIRIEDNPKAIGFRPDAVDNIKLPEHIIVMPEDQEALRKAHNHFYQLISASSAPKLAYQSGSRGIVSTAGGAQLPIMITSLHMLRRTGSELPIEIFVADASEYDEFICNTLLPTLNAKCVVLEDILKFSPLVHGLKKYQFKIFSLLFSSFEQVLFLDADAFPIRDPTHLFTSELFTSNGLITWPDFWQVTYNPAFFHITSQKVPTSFPYAATESGQLLVSKKTHWKMLFLSAYYNFYGPSYYYPMFTQGHHGEGDKETFIPPSLILGLPFYSVSTGPAVFGYRKNDIDWEGGVILQADPVWDSKLKKGESYNWHDKPYSPPESMLTLHCNLPKLDPVVVFGDGGLAWTRDGKPKRMWGTEREMYEKVGFDVEKALWNELRTTACQLHGHYPVWAEMGLCVRINKFIADMAGK